MTLVRTLGRDCCLPGIDCAIDGTTLNMAFTLQNVVPWGRSWDEYRRMFCLADVDLKTRMLGCADGPASFNAEMTDRGGSVVSFDPIYESSAEEIRRRFDQTYPQMIHQARQNASQFVWSAEIPDVDALGRIRTATMNRFLVDYEQGRRVGRYIAARLPDLPFDDGTFDIALCSHFLFLYSEQLSEQFHVESICELMRVATETRIFPLTDLGATSSHHLEPVIEALQNNGYHAECQTVDYEFQRGGNQMMRITQLPS